MGTRLAHALEIVGSSRVNVAIILGFRANYIPNGEVSQGEAMKLRVLLGSLLVYVVVATGTNTALAQTVETGFVNRVVHLDGAEFRYQVYVPREFRRTTTWPVILTLHGGGEYGDDGLRQTEGGLAKQFATIPIDSQLSLCCRKPMRTIRRDGS